MELVHELLQKLPASVAGFADNQLDAGQGFAAVQWMLEPEMAGKRIPTFSGPLARALETRRLEFFQSDLVLAYVSRKFSRGKWSSIILWRWEEKGWGAGGDRGGWNVVVRSLMIVRVNRLPVIYSWASTHKMTGAAAGLGLAAVLS